MTQSDVLNLLKNKRKWMTSKEINNTLNYNSACANLKQLLKYGDVERKDNPKSVYKEYVYKIKGKKKND